MTATPSPRTPTLPGPRPPDPSPSRIAPAELFRRLTHACGHDARAPIRERIAEAGEAATPALLAGLKDPDDLTRWEAVNLLGVIASPRTARCLVEFALTEDERHASWRSFWSVTRLDRSRTIPLLRRAVRSQRPERRWRAALVLSMLGEEEAGPTLLAGLEDPDPWRQWEALSAIKALGLGGAERPVARFLGSEISPHLRHEATLALGCIGSPLAARILRKALHDEAPGVRWRAALSLGRVGAAALRDLRRRREQEHDETVMKQIDDEILRLEAHDAQVA